MPSRALQICIYIYTTLCPSNGLLWLRTTLLHFSDDTWALDEFCQNISDLASMTSPFDVNKQLVEVITIAHTATVPPEVLGFTLHDDVVIMPRAGIPLRVNPPAARSEMEVVPAAAEEAEQPLPERSDEVNNHEVIIDGLRLGSNSSLKTLRTACESLGLAVGGGKANCLKRLWEHLQGQELIAAHGAQPQLRGDLVRPANVQPVPAEPSECEIAEPNLTHQPFAAWCELCVANRSQQDIHPARRDEPAGAHTCVSFDFGTRSQLLYSFLNL